MTDNNFPVPSLDQAANEGGLGNLVKGIGEESPEILTTLLGAVVASTYGAAAGLSAIFGVKVLHGALKGQGWRQIAVAFQKLKDQGKIREDFIGSDLGKACLSELLEAIEKSPDPRRIQAIKNAFLRIATASNTTEMDAIYQQQLLHTIGALSAGELILLVTMHRTGGANLHHDAQKWLNEMAQKTGFNDEGLVELSETTLIEKLLVLPRTSSDRSGVRWGNCNRLTGLGERVCGFIKALE